MKLIKEDPHIAIHVDERKIINRADVCLTHRPVHPEGKIGFRHVQWSHFGYQQFHGLVVKAD
jgi:hypothetical protein